MRADGRRYCANDACKKLITKGMNGRRKYCSDKCGLVVRAIPKTCPVCRNEFHNPNKKTVCCSYRCARVLSEKNRQKYYEGQARTKLRRHRISVVPSASRGSPLDSIPNPFAGALNARERAELQEKCNYIRSYISNHNGNMGDNLLSRSTRAKRGGRDS